MKLRNQVKTVPYMPGVDTGTTQYVSIPPSEKTYIRELLNDFLYDVAEQRDDHMQGSQLYDIVFNQPQIQLPKPTRLKAKYNTYASFIKGLEENFDEHGTRHYTKNQLSGIEECVRMAANYFTDLHPDIEPDREVYYVEFE